MAARVLLCDSQLLARIGLRTVLAGYPSVELVGEVDHGERAVRYAARLAPDVVLADMALPGLDGVALTRHLIGDHRPVPGVLGPRPGSPPAVLLIAPAMDDKVLQALRAGASGILLRTCDPDELVRAIQVVLDGGGFLAPQVARHVLDRISGRVVTGAGSAAVNTLTRREQEVLELLARGLSNVEIGERLFVGEPTVKYHVSQLLRKLELRDRLQAAAFAYQNGLVGW
jgi:DNA-binding NarL/FixJ family response regulator